MNSAIVQLLFSLFFFVQFGPASGEPLLKNVRNFAEEAVKSIDLVKLSHYFVDYAHLNGLLMINKDQFEEIAEEMAETSEVIQGESEKSKTKQQPKKHGVKQLKEVDKNQLSNHLSITISSTLLPSPYPRELFKLAERLQPLMATLHLRASFNVKLLLESTKTMLKSDKLVAGMVKIMERVERAGRRNPITLIIQRSDYLTDEEVEAGRRKISLKQIEATNSIGKGQGFGHLITKSHQRALEKVKQTRPKATLPKWLIDAEVQQNDILQKQAEALYKAWKLFTAKYSAPEAIILLIAVPKRKHYCHFEQLMWQKFQLEDIAWAEGRSPLVESITFEEMVNKLKVQQEGEDGKLHLFYENQNAEGKLTRRQVAIAYFQDGFVPEHFTRDQEWHIRELMEMSTAIMSPSVYLHLMGSKTVQHELAKPGVMEQYFADEPEKAELVAELRGTFIEMWALGGAEDDSEIVERAIANPGGYVLKTNTDGGNGNTFGEAMAEMLRGMRTDRSARSKYLIQKRIAPFRIKNAIVPQPPATEESIKFAEVDTELSIYGSLLAEAVEDENGNVTGEHKIHFNDYDGYLGRTKLSTNAQCNVSAGFGGIDSLVLFPKDNFEYERH